MSKSLVIVESPGKIKKFSSILGPKYIVMASIGHIRDLDSRSMSIDIENDFSPQWIISKEDVVRRLKAAVKVCKEVILAADDDREGEGIAASLAEVLKLKNPKRIVFGSITKSEILKAMSSPRKIDYKLVNAQKSRVILDKIVGYRLSPLLWQNIANKLSAGRVQSVVLRLIIDRENVINDHDSNNYFKTIGYFEDKKSKLVMKSVLNEKNEKKSTDTQFKGVVARINKEKDVNKLLQVFGKSKFKVCNVFDKKSEKNPSSPFITSSLQQEASSKLGFSPKVTMGVAKKLYEAGHITYLRTDSNNLSGEAMNQCKKYIVDKYSDTYYKKRVYKTKSKNAQEAHEAIRPTHIDVTSLGNMGSQEKRLYALIWKRTVASQMSPAKIKTTFIQIEVLNEKNKKLVSKYYFETSVEKIVFDGFLKVYNIVSEEDSEENEENETNKIPKKNIYVTANEIISTEEYTKPIGRYTEASLVKELEKRGIGRPSTYAPMVEKIQKKEYVKKTNVKGSEKDISILTLKGTKITTKKKKIHVGKEKNKLVPQHVGFEVTNYLLKNFDDIMDYKFTANMEKNLDKIASGKLEWLKLLNNFYDPFNKKYNSLKSNETTNHGRYLGEHPETKYKVYATTTKVGHAVKMVSPEKGVKSTYISIENPHKVDTITLKEALSLTNKYPKDLGLHKGKMVTLKKGMHGLYVTCDGKNTSVDDENISLKEAIKLFETKNKNEIKELKIGRKTYKIRNGPHGPYISYPFGKKRNCVSIPKDIDPKEITAAQVKDLVTKPKKKNNNNIKEVKIGSKNYLIRNGPHGPYIMYSVNDKKKFVSIPENIEPDKISVAQVKKLVGKK